MYNSKISILVVLGTLAGGCSPVSIADLPESERNRILANAPKEPIVGAFGITLGEPFDVDQALGRTDFDPDGYYFLPENPYEDFKSYYVIRSPKTGIAAEIHATSEEMPRGECYARHLTLSVIYKKKYKELSTVNHRDFEDYGGFVDDNGGMIMLGCVGFVDYRLTVNYFIAKYARMANEERLQLDVESKSKDGL